MKLTLNERFFFQASAIPSRSSAEQTSTQVLLTPNESDNIFVTLEEDFHDVIVFIFLLCKYLLFRSLHFALLVILF